MQNYCLSQTYEFCNFSGTNVEIEVHRFSITCASVLCFQ